MSALESAPLVRCAAHTRHECPRSSRKNSRVTIGSPLRNVMSTRPTFITVKRIEPGIAGVDVPWVCHEQAAEGKAPGGKPKAAILLGRLTALGS